jgi:AbrB family looped-hinge helix DNA binding protein
MNDVKTKIGSGGRIVIPSRYRKTIGVAVGDEVVLILDGEGMRVMTPRQAVKQAQRLVRKYVPRGLSLADELIEERRKETESG